jgi:hypothetical protein
MFPATILASLPGSVNWGIELIQGAFDFSRESRDDLKKQSKPKNKIP